MLALCTYIAKISLSLTLLPIKEDLIKQRQANSWEAKRKKVEEDEELRWQRRLEETELANKVKFTAKFRQKRLAEGRTGRR